MANQIVNVLASLIQSTKQSAEDSLNRDRKLAEAIKLLSAKLDKAIEGIAEIKAAMDAQPVVEAEEEIGDDDAAKLLDMLKSETGVKVAKPEPKPEPKVAKPEPKVAKPALKTEPQPEPEEIEEEGDEEIDEEEEEEALDNVANPDETKSIFQSKSTGRQRIICMNYLKQAGHKSECRMPDKLTWDYCSTIKADESSSKSAIQQWLEFVVAYEQSNG